MRFTITVHTATIQDCARITIGVIVVTEVKGKSTGNYTGDKKKWNARRWKFEKEAWHGKFDSNSMEPTPEQRMNKLRREIHERLDSARLYEKRHRGGTYGSNKKTENLSDADRRKERKKILACAIGVVDLNDLEKKLDDIDNLDELEAKWSLGNEIIDGEIEDEKQLDKWKKKKCEVGWGKDASKIDL